MNIDMLTVTLGIATELQDKVDRLEAINADLLEALQDMILATRRRMVVYFLSTEEEAVLAKAVAVVAKAEGLT